MFPKTHYSARHIEGTPALKMNEWNGEVEKEKGKRRLRRRKRWEINRKKFLKTRNDAAVGREDLIVYKTRISSAYLYVEVKITQ